LPSAGFLKIIYLLADSWGSAKTCNRRSEA
jgi:hypothetical protein